MKVGKSVGCNTIYWPLKILIVRAKKQLCGSSLRRPLVLLKLWGTSINVWYKGGKQVSEPVLFSAQKNKGEKVVQMAINVIRGAEWHFI